MNEPDGAERIYR